MSADVPPRRAALGLAWQRLVARTAGLSPTVRGLLWSASAGFLFAHLNALMRLLSQQLDPFQTQFLRYLFSFLVLLPLVLRAGLASYWPKQVSGHFTRGAVHTLGLCLWFLALPHVPLADMTAIGFTGPIFIMIGAYVFFRETMHWERWLAAAVGLAGVLIVVTPKLTGSGGAYNLVMLASAALLGGILFPGQRDAQAATLILSVGWVLQAYAENLSAYFQAVERMGRWTQASALFGLVSSAAGVTLLLATGSLVAFSFGLTLGWAAALAWLHLKLPSEARGGDAPSRTTVMDLARGTAPFAAAFVALTLYCKVDVLLLRHWQGDEQVVLEPLPRSSGP